MKPEDVIYEEADALDCRAIGLRLAEVRDGEGLPQQVFASHLGLNLRTYQRYEMGEVAPKAQTLAKLAAQGVDLNWLLNGPAQTGYGGQPPDISGFVMVPRFDVTASAGPGAFAEDQAPVDFLAFRKEWLADDASILPGKAALISATGDSMEPTIRSGDILLVDRAIERVMDDAIYVIGYDERLLVKRVQRFTNGSVAIKSDNPAYETETLSADMAESLRIAGRVRWIGRIT